MSYDSSRPRRSADRDDDSDEWLIDAARKAGHQLPQKERTPGTSAWRVLLNAQIPEAEVMRIACATSGAQPADFAHISPTMGSLLSQGTASKHRVVPIGVHNGTLGVATTNPMSPVLERELAFAAKQRVKLYAASPADIIRATAIVYGAAYGTRADSGSSYRPIQPTPSAPSATQPRPAPVGRLSMSVPAPTDVATPAGATASQPAAASGAQNAATAQPAAPPQDLTDRLLATATNDRASEAILEPTTDGGLLVRLCVDGTVNDRFRIAEAHSNRLIQTLKERAKLDSSNTSHPQQGRISFDSPSGLVAIRVSIEPQRNARERAVLRLFSPQGLLGLDQLGYSSAEQHRLGQLLGSPTGLLVVAGPPGAGKTTTLYAAAREIRRGGRTVATVEEPIEYPLERVTQVQVSDSAHLSVAAAVHAMLTSPGDALVIGAPLDAPTMESCAGNDARGRLVIGSLGTYDLPSTIARLQELVPDRAALADVLQGVVLQRLVRRLCACAVSQPISELPDQQQRLLYGLPAAKVRRPNGCPSCRTTGYLGRLAIAQVVPMTAPLRAAVKRRASAAELAQVTLESGTPTLWDSGMHHVLEGETSLAELLDTVPPPENVAAAPQEDIDALLKQLLGTPRMKPDPAEKAKEVEGVVSQADIAAATGEHPVSSAATASNVTTSNVATSATPPAGTVRVLLVDDDASARRALAQELTKAGFAVAQAADGVAAVEFAKRLKPDLVLTEVALPKLDAIGMLGALSAESLPCRVVVITEQVDDALESWLRESGARDVLRRDLSTAALAERLRALAKV